MNTDAAGIGLVPFIILSVIFLFAVIGALAWGYGRLSAKNRSKEAGAPTRWPEGRP